MERNKNYYQLKKIKELMNVYSFNEDRSTAIVNFCENLNNGILLHWVVNGASEYIKSFESTCKIELSLMEMLKLFKITYIDGFGINEYELSFIPSVINEMIDEMSNYFSSSSSSKYTDLDDYLEHLSNCTKRLGVKNFDEFISNAIEEHIQNQFNSEEYIKSVILNYLYE